MDNETVEHFGPYGKSMKPSWKEALAMVLVRCEGHGKPKGRKQVYVQATKPLNYPDTAAICGIKGCENPGMVWLNSNEWAAYQAGQRVFEIPNAATKVKVR